MKNIYLKLSGPDLKGVSRDMDHIQWIELSTVSHHMHQPRSRSHTGGGTEHDDLVITKEIDVVSPLLYQALSSGRRFESAQIDVCRPAGDGGHVKYLEISLRRVLISNVSFVIADDPAPLESLSLGYEAIQWKYMQQAGDGRLMGNALGAWNLMRNSATFA